MFEICSYEAWKIFISVDFICEVARGIDHQVLKIICLRQTSSDFQKNFLQGPKMFIPDESSLENLIMICMNVIIYLTT